MSNVVVYQISAQLEHFEEKASGAAPADTPADINIRKGGRPACPWPEPTVYVNQ